MKLNHNEAVSPVIAILLMLVVTIIIAAVVSGFTGGLMSTSSKSAQLSLSGSYSISHGLSITHKGGDPINLESTQLYLRNSEEWGSSAQKMRHLINQSYITDNNGNSVDWFKAGDTIYVFPPYSEGPYLQSGISSSSYYNSTSNLGKPIKLDVIDSSGHAITTIQFVITS